VLVKKRVFPIILSIPLLLFALSGCKEEEKNESPQGNSKEVLEIKETYLVHSLNLLDGASTQIKSGLCYEIEIPFFRGKQGIFKSSTLPPWASFDSKKGSIQGCPDEPGLFSQLEFTVEDSLGVEAKSEPYALEVLGDPLASSSWHLRNTGQTSFAFQGGVAGEDMKVAEAIRLGLTGAGVEIAVSDTGLEISHEDLKENILNGKSKNYVTGTDDPTSTEPRDGDHGTSVAGIIAAVGWNGKGGRGIAPGAKLVGLNFLAPEITLAQHTAAYYDQAQNDFDIVNQSWGTHPRGWYQTDSDYVALLKNAVGSFREGRGTIFIKSAGNFFPDNAALDPDQRNPYQVVVGALTAEGKAASYSSAGANLWISGLAGEFGLDSEAKKKLSSNTNSKFFKSAILTTDVSGCEKGDSRRNLIATYNEDDPLSFFRSIFNYDVVKEQPHPSNLDCNYTNTFNGTSAAAPSISGVVALMLEKNPNLTWRDVKHILAVTAQPVDLTSTGAFPWVKNFKNYQFNNRYGFGRANAKEAVALAGNYSSNWGPLEDKEMFEGKNSNLQISITSQAVTQRELSFVVSSELPNLSIEAVEVVVDITHSNPNHLNIEIKSPSGTVSRLHSPIGGNALSLPNMPQISLLTNAFYGEESKGKWTLSMRNSSSTTNGVLKSWGVRVYGHRP